MMFIEIIAVHYENHTKSINTFFGQKVELLIKADGKPPYCYFWAVKVKHAWLKYQLTYPDVAVRLMKSMRNAEPISSTLKSQHLKFSTCCCFVDVIVSME
jgi:hypothetical protein